MGDKHLEYTQWRNNPLWDDLLVPVTSTRKGGSKDPSFEVFQTDGLGSQGVFSSAFIHTSEKELYFTAQLPHSYKQQSDLECHVHWSPEENSAGVVRWGFEYTWATIYDDFPPTTIIYGTETLPINKAKNHEITAFPTIVASNQKISSMLICRIFRDVAVASNYTHKAFLHQFDFHFQKDTEGSRQQWVK